MMKLMFLILIALVLVSMAIMVVVARRRRPAAQQAIAPHDATTWCEGCEQLRLMSSMAWDAAERYRCRVCRGVPKKEPNAAPKPPKAFMAKSSPSEPITGREIVLGSVAPGQVVLASGGKASIEVLGDVGERANLRASGGAAKITVKGHVGAYAELCVAGGAGRIWVASADPTAITRASGGGSSIVRSKTVAKG